MSVALTARTALSQGAAISLAICAKLSPSLLRAMGLVCPMVELELAGSLFSASRTLVSTIVNLTQQLT